MKTALIIGADGMIGGALAPHLKAQNVLVTRFARPQLDLAHPASWSELPRVDVAYLCAAITKLDACENDPRATHHINVTNTLKLAERLRAHGCFVVFLSSNQVFDGLLPYRKASDAPCPMNAYGRQKAETERALLAHENTAVLRLTKVISAPLPMLGTWETQLLAGQTIEAFDDLVFAPVPLQSVLAALTTIGENRTSGISQLSGTKDISYFAIAQLLADKFNINRNLVIPISAQTKGILPQFLPKHGTLQSSNFEGIIIPPPEEIVFS